MKTTGCGESSFVASICWSKRTKPNCHFGHSLRKRSCCILQNAPGAWKAEPFQDFRCVCGALFEPWRER